MAESQYRPQSESIRADGERSVAAASNFGVIATGDNPVFVLQSSAKDSRPGVVTPDKQIFHLPRPVTEVFVGREDIVAQLRSQREGGAKACVIFGLGGIGKSELVLQYADTCRRELRVIWWISAEGARQVQEGLAKLAHRIAPLSKDLPIEEAANQAVDWLNVNPDWLLILDNVDEPSSVRGLLANLQGEGQLIVTTRRNVRWPRQCEVIQLKELSQLAALELVRRVTDLRDLEEEEAPLQELVDVLGRLPLALDQASAYMRQTQILPSRYLDKLSKQPVQIFDAIVDGDKQQATILQVWNVTLAALVERSEDAVEVLHILAFCAPDDIPRAVIGDVDSGEDFDAHLGLLASFSMVSLTSEAVHIHRLVRHVLLLGLLANPDVGKLARDICFDWLAAHLPASPDGDLDSWPLLRRLIPHFESIVRFYPEDERTGELGSVFNALGLFEATQGNYRRALSYRKIATETALSVLGEEHVSSAISMGNLGISYRDLGDYEKALELQRGALAIAERCGAEEHVLAVMLGQLGRTLAESGSPTEALEYLQRSIPLAETAWGSNSIDTAIRLSDLAKLHQSTGNLEKAVPIFEKALRIAREVLPAGHPILGIRMGDLAGAYNQAERHNEAIALAGAALDILLNSLGESHPITDSCLTSLSKFHQDSGDLDAALELANESLCIVERNRPWLVPDRLADKATILSDLGRHSEAIDAVERALQSKGLARRTAVRLEMLLRVIKHRASR